MLKRRKNKGGGRRQEGREVGDDKKIKEGKNIEGKELHM